MMGTDFPERYKNLPDGDGKDLFVHVTDILRQGDVVFGNLEQVLSDNGQCAKDISRPNMWAFRSPANYVENLKRANFNVMSIANNHAWDFGKEGSADTMKALDAVGIKHSGPIGDIAHLEINNFRIALIAFSRNLNGYSFLNPRKSKEVITSLSRQFDIVIVSFHGGAEGVKAQHTKDADEYLGKESRGNVVKFSRNAIDNGADLVIGHGPHVPRAIELYNNKLIAYSLGNFCTYGIISIKGIKGIAPILKVKLDDNGDFVSGRIYSFKQEAPGFPVPDKSRKAVSIIKQLTEADFPNSGLIIDEDGNISIRPL
jgi:poly-gamma-glutamate capsule biosynthesis protein CapA/YwtB (metallophosphatase superfamily)